MEQKFLIKTTALKLLEELYFKSDSSLRATVNAFSLFDDPCDKDLVIKASQYLIKKKYVDANALASTCWTASITVSGIDWVEEIHNNL